MIAKVNGKLLSLLLKMILNLSNLTEEMEKRLSDQLRYLTISAIDEEWGIVVTTVGYQFIPPKGNYPLSKHPDNYNFKPQTGRILNEYQLVYITKGSGYFSSQSCKMQKINAGTMILLFPGEWHSYYPDSEFPRCPHRPARGKTLFYPRGTVTAHRAQCDDRRTI